MLNQVSIVIACMLFIVVGLLAKNKQTRSIEGFSTKRNKLSWFVIAAGVSMTFIGGAVLLNAASLGYIYKWYTLVDPVAMMIGIIVSVLFVKKYRNDTGITISQLLSGSNKNLSVYIGLITSAIFLMVIAAQFVAFSKLLAPYFPAVNPILLVIIPPGIILLYVFLGGFAAVTNTDVLQLFFMFIFLVVPVAYYVITKHPAVLLPASEKARFMPMPGELIIYLFISALFVPLSQDINIRAKSAKNIRNATAGFIFGGIIYGSIVMACSYIGITLAENGVTMTDRETAFPTFFKQFYPTFGIFPILAGMAAIWSTLDTYLVNCITAVANDILKKRGYFQKFEERKLIIISGLVIFLAATVLSLYFNEVLHLILSALLIYISVLIPIALAKKMKMQDNAVLVLSVITVFIILMCEVFKIDIYPKPVIYPAGAVALMLVGRLYQRAVAGK